MNTVRILVVDDVALDAHIVRDHLITQEYDVEVVHNPREAFDLITTKNGYDLLIFDVNLPGLDGLTLTKRLRQQGVMTPVLLLSGGVDPDVKLTITTMGPSVSYLEKNGSKELLLASCSDLLSRNQLVRLVYKMNDRMGRMEEMVSKSLPSTEQVTEITRNHLLTHCPHQHTGVKEEVRVSRSAEILQVEETFRTQIHQANDELAETLGRKIDEATDVSTLFTKAKEHSMFRTMMALMAFIGTSYVSFAAYSHTLTSQNSVAVIQITADLQVVKSKIEEQNRQMGRIETLLTGVPPSPATSTPPGRSLP